MVVSIIITEIILTFLFGNFISAKLIADLSFVKIEAQKKTASQILRSRFHFKTDAVLKTASVCLFIISQ